MPTDTPSTDSGAPDRADADAALRAALLQRWEDLLPGQTALGESLIARYAESHRRYHGLRHLETVLDWIDRLAGREDLFLVRLGAWYHDAVYRVPVGQVTNEEASARLVMKELGRAGFEQEDLNQVARLVRLTETHRVGARDPEGALLCDADLAVLGGTPQEYARYVREVREEYGMVSDEDFARGRYAVLIELLGQETLFRTQRGRALNDPAHHNLDAECAALETRLGITRETERG